MSLTARSEDARNFYQQRLAILYRVAFAISLVFLVGEAAAHAIAYGTLAGHFLDLARVLHMLVTAVLGAVWWWLARAPASYGALEVFDTALVLFLGLVLNVGSALYDDRVVLSFNLALVPGAIAVLRAVVVPSTGRRTLLLGVAAGALAAAVLLVSLHPAWPARPRMGPDFPLVFQVTTVGLWLGGLVAIATVASRVIYHLRREVRAARKLGQYVLGEKLGEGGMGVVYRATHALLRRETALKLLPPDRVDGATLRRFEREVVETARLRHPSTVAIFDYGRTPDGVFYYAMEYLDGFTLGELVQREGPLPPGRVVWLLAQVCASLEEAHGIGLVHRDIKPANLMVVGYPAAYDLVKVLDFGLVKSAAPLDGGASLTGLGQLTGTPLYMAPETITRPDGADARSDLYAVAAVGYYLLAGRHVFEGSSAVEICAAHLHRPPQPIRERSGREVPRDLEALLLRGLAKPPADRPAGAAAFREALLRCDVPPWTEDDARAWWRTHGERARRAGPAELRLADAPTVTVVRDVG